MIFYIFSEMYYIIPLFALYVQIAAKQHCKSTIGLDQSVLDKQKKHLLKGQVGHFFPVQVKKITFPVRDPTYPIFPGLRELESFPSCQTTVYCLKRRTNPFQYTVF